jgi:hypothetical protein
MEQIACPSCGLQMNQGAFGNCPNCHTSLEDATVVPSPATEPAPETEPAAPEATAPAEPA